MHVCMESCAADLAEISCETAVCQGRHVKSTSIVVLLWSIVAIRLPTQTAGMPCSVSCLKDSSHAKVARDRLITGMC